MKGDKNNIFFNIIHYVLSEQANVDWILKSSFINFTGLSTEVNFSKFQKPNLIDDILQYITHIKPYHTKFDQFIEKYTSKNDKVKILGDRKETTDGTFIVIHNLVEFFNVTEKIRFDNVTLMPDIERYNNLPTNSKSALREFWETTSANRLYANTTKDIDMISDILRGGFKGLTLDGGDFLIDNYGYDVKPYDSTLYDAPNITNNYFIVDRTEIGYENYTKTFTKIQNNLLKTNHPYNLARGKIKIYSYFNNLRTEITEFNIIDDIINIFRGIRKYEKIVITVSETEIDGSITKYNYIFVGVAFSEEFSDTGINAYADYGTLSFKIPDSEFGIKTMKAYLIDDNGNKSLITNYTKNGNMITLSTIPPEFSTVSITVIDYSYIYDRIYAYEDVYASQNNLMYLDGEGFLRPHWDVKHPSELTMSRGRDFLFIKEYDEDKPLTQRYIDVWRNETLSDWDEGEKTELATELKAGDRYIYVKNAGVLEKPKIDKDGIKIPGVICIDDEIIEFYNVNGNTLSSIKRATRGSSFKTKYPKGTNVWDFAGNNTSKTNRTYYTAGYQAISSTYLTKELNITDNEIYLNDTSVLYNKPTYYDSGKVKTPGTLRIKNEIIEYDYIEGNKVYGLARGASAEYYPASVPVYNTNYQYVIPSDIEETSQIDVYKTYRVNMLNNLTPDSQYVIFDKPILNILKEVSISYKPTSFFKIAKGNKLGIKLGNVNDTIIIDFNKDINSLEEFISYMNKNIPSNYNFKVYDNNGFLTFTSFSGNSIILYNNDGYPIQELFDSTNLGSVINPIVHCNGVDGIIINGFKTIWGNYAHTIKWLKNNPYYGDINEIVLSINGNKNLQNKVLARNNENRLELVSLDGNTIEVSRVGQTVLSDIGLKDNVYIPECVTYSENYSSLIVEQKRANQAGTVVINGKTIYFYTYYEYINEETNEMYSRIEDIRTDQTILAEDAIITTPSVYHLTENEDYTINDNKITLSVEPKEFEAIYITNNILPKD